MQLKIGRGCLPLTVVGLALGAMSAAPGRSEEQHTITVCELFRDLRAYSGLTVRLRGELVTDRHTFALGERGCSVRFTAGGLEWPTTVDLRSKELESPGSSDVDRLSIEKMDKLLCFLNNYTAAELDVEINATFIGEVRTRERYRPNQSPAGTPSSSGYGDMGRFPAQLVYRAVEDIVIRQRSK